MDIKTFTELVKEQAAAIQGRSTQLVDMQVGSILRSVVEAYSGVAMWLQSMALTILARTRAGSSSGADLDSWMADYGLVRLEPTHAVGQVTFVRQDPSTLINIAVGTRIKASDTGAIYEVIADPAQSRFVEGSYQMRVGESNVSLPVQAISAGAASNVAQGNLNTMVAPVPGISIVYNAATISTGTDTESDAQFRARFVQYLRTLSRATRDAVISAAQSVRPGLNVLVEEYLAPDGSTKPGFFKVVVDDGTGVPPDGLIAQVYSAVDAVRPLGIYFTVGKPVRDLVSIGMGIQVYAGYSGTTVRAAVHAQVSKAVESLGIGEPLFPAVLISTAMSAHPGVQNVSNLSINGASASVINPAYGHVIRIGALSIT